jgi:endonuclease/exonuclease/phosphatase (EEP) superfamily protein YafD
MNWRSFFLPKPRNLILRFALIASLFPIIGLLGGGVLWFFDLFNHFQFQYLGFLSLCLLILLTIRAAREAKIVAVLLMLPLARVAPAYFPPAAVASSGATIRVASYNVLVTNDRHEDALNWVRESNPDCIYFSETTATWARALQPLSRTYPYSIEERTGFAFYSKFPITRHEIVSCSDHEYPLLIAHLATPNGDVAFFGMHPLPPLNEAFAQALEESLSIIASKVEKQSGRVIVVGDLNSTRWSKMSRPLERAQLLDACRGKSPGPTWMRSIPLFAIPIDRILYRGENMSCRSFQIAPDLGSDHRPIMADFVW